MRSGVGAGRRLRSVVTGAARLRVRSSEEGDEGWEMKQGRGCAASSHLRTFALWCCRVVRGWVADVSSAAAEPSSRAEERLRGCAALCTSAGRHRPSTGCAAASPLPCCDLKAARAAPALGTRKAASASHLLPCLSLSRRVASACRRRFQCRCPSFCFGLERRSPSQVGSSLGLLRPHCRLPHPPCCRDRWSVVFCVQYPADFTPPAQHRSWRRPSTVAAHTAPRGVCSDSAACHTLLSAAQQTRLRKAQRSTLGSPATRARSASRGDPPTDPRGGGETRRGKHRKSGLGEHSTRFAIQTVANISVVDMEEWRWSCYTPQRRDVCTTALLSSLLGALLIALPNALTR